MSSAWNAWFDTVGVLSSLVGAYGISQYLATLSGLVPIGAATPPLIPGLRSQPAAIYIHATASGVALIVCGLQILPSFRKWASLKTHRRVGWVYASCVTLGSISGMVLSLRAVGGAVSTVGFFSLAIAWFGTTAAAVYEARRGRVARHAYLMAHSTALCFAAVTLRMYLPLALVPGANFASVYSKIAWLSWVPNVMAVELYHRYVAWHGTASKLAMPGAGQVVDLRGPGDALATDDVGSDGPHADKTSLLHNGPGQ